MIKESNIICYNKGYATLITLLVVAAVGVTIAISLTLLGIGASKSSFAIEQSNQSKALSNACLESALQEIRNSTPFAGSATINLGQGTCTYTVTNTGGTNRNIIASSTVGRVVRKVEVNIDQINPDINIISWQEVADF